MTVFIHIIVCLASLNLGLSVRSLLCHKTIMHSITGKKAVDFQIFFSPFFFLFSTEIRLDHQFGSSVLRAGAVKLQIELTYYIQIY